MTILQGHQAPVSSIEWSPSSSKSLISGGDDGQALIWDIQTKTKKKDPVLAYGVSSDVHQVSWGKIQSDWVAVSYGDVIEALHIF